MPGFGRMRWSGGFEQLCSVVRGIERCERICNCKPCCKLGCGIAERSGFQRCCFHFRCGSF